MRLELQVDLRPTGRHSVAKPIVDAEARAETQRLVREDRRLRQIALARLIEDRIAAGEFASLADVARRCGVSRARVSQLIANLNARGRQHKSTLHNNLYHQTGCERH